jgi:hypothetical protein
MASAYIISGLMKVKFALTFDAHVIGSWGKLPWVSVARGLLPENSSVGPSAFGACASLIEAASPTL